jgi:serine/threonine protein kinase
MRASSRTSHGATDDGVPYLAMEWLAGESLAERLARAPLTVAESLDVARATARGLAVAHERGIVHRDLKPSNLFLRAGIVDDVVLLDLGIARLVADERSLTRTGAILGTPSYMAPEQASGRGPIAPAADVFSLGCVLFD